MMGDICGVLLFSTSVHFSVKGYSTSGDLRCVLSTWPQFSEEPLVTQGVLDLVNVHQKVLQFLHKCFGFLRYCSRHIFNAEQIL